MVRSASAICSALGLPSKASPRWSWSLSSPLLPRSARTFVHLFSVLLLVAGTLLGTAGILSIRAGPDRIRKRNLAGRAANTMASLTIAAGTLALILLAMGLAR